MGWFGTVLGVLRLYTDSIREEEMHNRVSEINTCVYLWGLFSTTRIKLFSKRKKRVDGSGRKKSI